MAGVVGCVMFRVQVGSGIFMLSCSSLYCPTLQCVWCHSIVGLGRCVCDGVVSLWNSGGGLCVAEERVCDGVRGVFSLVLFLFSFLSWCSG